MQQRPINPSQRLVGFVRLSRIEDGQHQPEAVGLAPVERFRLFNTLSPPLNVNWFSWLQF
jgi:hypothetical protein